MIEQNVQVLQCESQRFWVRMGAQSGCTACEQGKGCGAGLFARLFRGKPVVLELARKDMRVNVGQMLTLALPERVYMKLVFASYGWPLLAALFGAVAGYNLAVWLQLKPLLIDALTLVCGVLTAWASVYFLRRRKTVRMIFESMDIRICHSSDTPNICSGTSNKAGQI